MQSKTKLKSATSHLQDSQEPLMCKPQKYKFKFTSEQEVSDQLSTFLINFCRVVEWKFFVLPSCNYHSFSAYINSAANFVTAQLSKVHPSHLQDSYLRMGNLHRSFQHGRSDSTWQILNQFDSLPL